MASANKTHQYNTREGSKRSLSTWWSEIRSKFLAARWKYWNRVSHSILGTRSLLRLSRGRRLRNYTHVGWNSSCLPSGRIWRKLRYTRQWYANKQRKRMSLPLSWGRWLQFAPSCLWGRWWHLKKNGREKESVTIVMEKTLTQYAIWSAGYRPGTSIKYKQHFTHAL